MCRRLYLDCILFATHYHRDRIEQRLRLAHDHIRMATLYLAAILRAHRSSLRYTRCSADHRFFTYGVQLYVDTIVPS